MKSTMMLPTTGSRWIRNEVDRLLDRMWDGDDVATMGEWTPRVDLTESPDALMARVEIPGIDPKDVQVTLENEILTVKGEKREEIDEKKERFLRTERSYGAFIRTMKLPMAVDGARVVATFKNGLLEIVMPKAPGAKGMTIPIKLS
jgi:HSP20 family protein